MLGEKPGSRGGSQAGSRRSNREDSTDKHQVEPLSDGNSWMLDNVSEAVYLATQVNLTNQTADALNKLEEGKKESLQVQFFFAFKIKSLFITISWLWIMLDANCALQFFFKYNTI